MKALREAGRLRDRRGHRVSEAVPSGRNAARRHVAQEKENRMTMLPSLPEEVRVKYNSVAVFAVPKFDTTVIDELTGRPLPGQPTTGTLLCGHARGWPRGVRLRAESRGGRSARQRRPADQEPRTLPRSGAALRSWGDRLHQWVWRLSRR